MTRKPIFRLLALVCVLAVFFGGCGAAQTAETTAAATQATETQAAETRTPTIHLTRSYKV